VGLLSFSLSRLNFSFALGDNYYEYVPSAHNYNTECLVVAAHNDRHRSSAQIPRPLLWSALGPQMHRSPIISPARVCPVYSCRVLFRLSPVLRPGTSIAPLKPSPESLISISWYTPWLPLRRPPKRSTIGRGVP
jgi:hypothetical protein